MPSKKENKAAPCDSRPLNRGLELSDEAALLRCYNIPWGADTIMHTKLRNNAQRTKPCQARLYVLFHTPLL